MMTVVGGNERRGEHANTKKGERAACKLITSEDLRPFFHLPITQVAEHFHICTTVMKKVCRNNGIPRWPYRKLSAIEKKIETIRSTVTLKSHHNAARLSNELENLEKRKRMILENPACLAKKSHTVTSATIQSSDPLRSDGVGDGDCDDARDQDECGDGDRDVGDGDGDDVARDVGDGDDDDVARDAGDGDGDEGNLLWVLCNASAMASDTFSVNEKSLNSLTQPPLNHATTLETHTHTHVQPQPRIQSHTRVQTQAAETLRERVSNDIVLPTYPRTPMHTHIFLSKREVTHTSTHTWEREGPHAMGSAFFHLPLLSARSVFTEAEREPLFMAKSSIRKTISSPATEVFLNSKSIHNGDITATTPSDVRAFHSVPSLAELDATTQSHHSTSAHGIHQFKRAHEEMTFDIHLRDGGHRNHAQKKQKTCE